jgi:cytochrome c oxidase subunit 2
VFTDSSPFSNYVDATFLTIVGISLLVLIGVLTAMVFFVVRYSRRKNPHPTNIAGHLPLEITWTVVPLILFMGMFYLGWHGYLMEKAAPESSLRIRVTAQMWKWSFDYPNGVHTDSLYVPVGVPIECSLHSLDVNHSFYIPAFRVKKDVIPNRENTMWFRTNQVASYDIMCAEYCGLNHSYMYSKVKSMDSTDFESWFRAESARQSKQYQPLAAILPK